MSIQHRHRTIKERAEARGSGKRQPGPHEFRRGSKGTPWPHEYPAASSRDGARGSTPLHDVAFTPDPNSTAAEILRASSSEGAGQ